MCQATPKPRLALLHSAEGSKGTLNICKANCSLNPKDMPLAGPIKSATALGQEATNRRLRQYASENDVQTCASDRFRTSYDALEVSTSGTTLVHTDMQQSGLLIRKTTNVTLPIASHTGKFIRRWHANECTQGARLRAAQRSEHLFQFWAVFPSNDRVHTHA